jgi:hypothetical protein
MKWDSAMVAILIGALALPATADAQVERKCRAVGAGAWQATAISAFNMGCRPTRGKLQRWFRADRRPLLLRNPDGWQCGPYSVPGRRANRQCRPYPRDPHTAVGFIFRLQRRLTASAAAGMPCGALTDGQWRATDIQATHLTCRSARTKLRRWLPPPLPANPLGWNCFPFRGRRMCAVGQGDAPRFTFRLRRRPVATAAYDIRRYRVWDAGGRIIHAITVCKDKYDLGGRRFELTATHERADGRDRGRYVASDFIRRGRCERFRLWYDDELRSTGTYRGRLKVRLQQTDWVQRTPWRRFHPR